METATHEQIARGANGRPEAADADPSSRPGVPMYKPSGTSSEIVRPPLEQQQSDVEVLVGRDIGQLTPVYGTCQPPRGLSGILRRAGYKIPEHKAGRWMTLLLADRVDVWESRVRRHPILTALVVAAVVGGARAGRPRRSKLSRLLTQLA
ncbi:MAG TPA: hypothetical protein VHO67_04310 [Polyangia bacterium]|nr:hypothetical protein [Polyangia bacterium]